MSRFVVKSGFGGFGEACVCQLGVSMFVLIAVAASFVAAAVIPGTAGNVSSAGFTRIKFCPADETLYAFNGLNLFAYQQGTDSFETVFAGVGNATGKTWDPADFTFLQDSNSLALPTGKSMGFVYAELETLYAEEKSGLCRNFYSIASRRFSDGIYANGVGDIVNTIYLLDMADDGSDEFVAEVSNGNSGAIAFDRFDHLYIADFTPMVGGLGKVDIYVITRMELDAFEQQGLSPLPRKIVNDAILPGSDSLAIDADNNIYVSSYTAVAKVTPTADVNDFTVTEVAGDVTANPHAGWPPPSPVFCGIAADMDDGVIYLGRSVVNEYWFYEPYMLETIQVGGCETAITDFYGDGITDEFDLVVLAGQYLGEQAGVESDLDGDGDVDLVDFSIFAGQWKDRLPWVGP